MNARPLKEFSPLAAWLIDRFWWIKQPQLRMLWIWAVRWSVVAPIFMAREAAAIGIERRSIVENAIVPALVNSPCMVWRICRRGLGTEHAWSRDVARVVASGFPWVPVLLALLLLGAAVWSAAHPVEGVQLAAFSVPFIEVQTGGDDTNNGGLFETNGPTFPTDGAATSATGTTPLFSSASYNFVNGDINHWIFVKSGSNWIPGWYKITAVSSNKATLDAAIGHVPLFDTNQRAASLNNSAGCATTASPTSATWGLDYSQTTTARFTSTHFSNDATNTHLLDADNTIGKNWVGNSVVITAAGTGFTLQRLVILSTSGTTATCDKSVGGTNLSGGGGGMGGCIASPALASGLGVANTMVWIKSGSYSVTTASTNVANGCISSTNGFVRLEAYGTIRGDRGGNATMTASGISTATLFLINAGSSRNIVRGIICDGAGLTSIRCFDITQSVGTYNDCAALNGTNGGFVFADGNLTACNLVSKNITGSNSFSCGLGSNVFIHSAVVSCTVPGFTVNISQGNTWIGCISANNSGASSDGFASNSNSWLVSCTAYLNGRDGFRGGNTPNATMWVNCVSEANVGNGFNDATVSPYALGVFARYCATYNNGTAFSNSFSPITEHHIPYTSTAFVNAAGNNFALNNVPTGGGMLRAAGFPGTFGGSIGSTGFADIGAVPAPHSQGFFIQ